MSTLDILNDLKEAYLTNFPAQIDEMETVVINVEKNRGDFKENFDALYRRAHSLKGSGGTFGFSIITAICHQLEDFLTSSFSSEDQINKENVDTIFLYTDLLRKTHELLEREATDFSEIVQKLSSIKKNESDHELKGLFVGPANQVYMKMCMHLFEETHIKCATIENGMIALNRLLHEHFDFLITSRENLELNGMALIAALKLNNGKNQNINTILITTTPPTNNYGIESDYVILKNKDFSQNLEKAMSKIRSSIL